jgi:hypothetical protein
MPIIAAAGAYVAGAIGLVGTAALIGGAIISTGIAYGISRIINGNPNKGNNSAAGSQGGRIQVPPATNNKIPLLYGSAFVNGIITDARLITTDQKINDTMFYCIVLSEYTNNLPVNSGNFIVGQKYTISTVGTTNFTLIGAASNTVGVTFTATGVGTGTGVARYNPVVGLESVYWNDLRLTPVDATTNAYKVKDGRKVVNGAIVSATAIVKDSTYIIQSQGTTNFTLIGAPTNNIGQIFTATGPGTGTGTAQEEDFVDDNFVVDGNSLVQLRVYAGGSEATDQIYPAQGTGATLAAYDFWGDNDNSWTNQFAMKGLVYAIVRVTYNGEKGFTGLPTMTFQVANNVANPADVWYDYMLSERYGANIDPAYIDTTARTAWANYCEEDIVYTDVAGLSTAVTTRYAINGVLDTSNQVKTNIDTILQNGGAWMSYNVATGLWSPIIKKAVTAGDAQDAATLFTASRAGTTLTVTAFPEGRIEAGQELYNSTGTFIGNITTQLFPLNPGETTGQIGRYTVSGAGGTITPTTFYTLAPNLLEFDDSNITSGITISATRLEDLYNNVEAEFYNKYNKDQKAYARTALPVLLRNPNEPDNELRMNLDLCNNSIQAQIISGMELRQSRDDLVISFSTTHYGIQTQAGDIISVSSELYDWSPKLFRVIRVKEQETDEGGLVAEIQAQEYNGDVYTIEPITEFTTEANIGIGVYGSSPNLPLPPRLVVVKVNGTDPIPNFQLQVQIPLTGGPYDEIEFYVTEGWDPFNITGSTTGGVATITATDFGAINPGDFFTVGAANFTIQAQLTNNPVSKTFASGGTFTPPVNTVTLNNTTGLIVGNTLIGTGLPALGAGITAISGSQVTLDTFFTAQAAGTYTVTGGLGTYSIDNPAVVSGTTQLFDLPEATDYGFFKRITPNGNRATFTNGETITVTITELPANSQIYRRWFIKSRMGINKRYGAFSEPSTVDKDGNFHYEPDPGGSSADVLNIKQALLKLDFGNLVIPNNGFLLFRTMSSVDFGNDNNIGSSAQLDLGLVSVVENAVTAASDVETFVWQNDPT